MDDRQKKNPDANDPGLQFPEIEKLIQSEDFDQINENFTTVYEELEKVGKGSSGLGKSREAKKAMKAIEKVMDLLRDLLKLKYQMAQQPEGSTPQGKK